jgi:hypothetical protein
MIHRSNPHFARRALAADGAARATAVLATLLMLLTAPPAQAHGEPDKTTDGAYGRFEGDLNLSLAAGATVGPGGPSAAAVVRAVFFETAGIYASYTDALGRERADLPRTVAIGVTVRPLFIPRWALDLERGPAILDLTLDGLSFDLGVIWPAKTDGALSERPGMETALGTEVPLLGRATGPFVGVRGALRWRAAELAGRAEQPLQPALFLTLAWHALIDANIVDAGDRRMR